MMIRKIITINEEKCNGCGLCADACHEGAIGMVDGKDGGAVTRGGVEEERETGGQRLNTSRPHFPRLRQLHRSLPSQ